MNYGRAKWATILVTSEQKRQTHTQRLKAVNTSLIVRISEGKTKKLSASVVTWI